MATSKPQFTPAQWDALFDRFHASGLTQAAFCKSEALVRHVFTYRYQRSEKFAGKRQGSLHTSKTNKQKQSGFRSVCRKPAPAVTPLDAEHVSIQIGHDVRLHCSAAVGVEAIMRLAREVQS